MFAISTEPGVPQPPDNSALHFQQLITEQSLMLGVKPKFIRHVARAAAERFELRDGHLVARDGATDPSDPLSPLTPVRWLQELQTTESYLFVEPGRTH